MRLFVALLLLPSLSTAQDAVLNGDTFKAWRKFIVPGADERRDEQIDWAPSLADGLKRAHAQEKPLLLWVMNGHPLGCT